MSPTFSHGFWHWGGAVLVGIHLLQHLFDHLIAQRGAHVADGAQHEAQLRKVDDAIPVEVEASRPMGKTGMLMLINHNINIYMYIYI